MGCYFFFGICFCGVEFGGVLCCLYCECMGGFGFVEDFIWNYGGGDFDGGVCVFLGD